MGIKELGTGETYVEKVLTVRIVCQNVSITITKNQYAHSFFSYL